MDARTLPGRALTVPIAAKLAASFMVLLAIVIAAGAVSLERLSAIESRAVAARDDWMPSARTLGQLRTTVRKYRLAEASLALAGSAHEIAAAAERLESTAAELARARENCQPYVTRSTEDERLMGEFDRTWAQYRTVSRRFIDARLGGEARQLEDFEAGRPYYEAVAAGLTQDIILNTRTGVEGAAEAVRFVAATRTLVRGALLALVLVAAALGLALTRDVALPLHAMTGAMKRLAARDFAVSIPGIGRRDELGTMAQAIDVFRESLIETETLRAREDLKTAELRASEARFRTVFDSVTEGIFVSEPDSGRFLEINPSGCAMFGYTREELLGLDTAALSSGMPPYTREDVGRWIAKARAAGPQTFEWQCRGKDGRIFWAEICVRLAVFGRADVVLATLRDIGERKQAERRIRRMARQDALTGLPNRGVFVDAVDGAIARAAREDSAFAVLFLDLDHFKDVNDTLGHPAGDDLLRGVAARLRGAVRDSDIVARFGGDEFAVLMPAVRDGADTAALAAKLIASLEPAFSIQGNDIRIGTSIGIAMGSAAERSVEAMLGHADVALYRAKADGRGAYRFFDESMDAKVRARVTLVGQLRTAIESQQLFLVYQPQVEIATGRITGIEALVRWQHPERGELSPGQFIAEAESSGLIVPLGREVLRQACRQARAWADAGLLPASVAVNISAAELRTPHELEHFIRGTLLESGLDPRCLELELTETVLMGSGSAPHVVLASLRAIGIRLAIDDFGTGFSSLDYLRRFPADRLKIAQSFVDQLERAGNAAVVKATIGLARELGMAVIAEGIESERQVEQLVKWGCSDGQGFHFGKPMTAQELEPLLRSGHCRYGRRAGSAESRVVQGPWSPTGRYQRLS
ncbi:MAG TPA: EAL domain-containing protein [Steroidobacteraceae bacterium]|nr:EAL domain-containing protein [Steroidobacteraceae bacterium]